MGLERLAGRIMLLDGWRRALLAFGSGLLATFALSPYNVPALGFVSFPVLVWLLDGASGEPGRGVLRRLLPAFRIGWCFGFGYFVGGLWWLGAAMLVDAGDFLWAMPLAVLGLPAILAIYWGLACMAARLPWSDGPLRLFALAAALAGFEFLRAILFTGFPWNEIGVMAAPVPLLMGSMALIGLHGLTLMAVFVFSLPALVAGRRRGRAAALALGVILTAAHVGFGAWRLAEAPVGTVPDVSLRIVQPNILQSQKWDAAESERIFARLLDLTGSAPAPGVPAAAKRFVVWPESSFPFVLTDRPDAVARLADTLGPADTLLAGATRVEAGSGPLRFYNSVMMIGGDGAILDATDKLHLVPFGEYLPFQEALEGLGISALTQLPGGFSAGSDRRTVELPGGGPAFLPLVCYEAIFQDELSLKGARRPDFILNVTNDAWYGRTPGPYQHLRQAQLTAVAFGLPLVRAANTGVSVVTDAAGRPAAGLALGEGGIVDAALPLAGPPTVFARLGNGPFGLLLAMAAVLAVLGAVPFSRKD